MTTEELLKPRRKVIAPYPGSPFKVGDILYWHRTGESGFGNDGFYSRSSHYEIVVTLYPPGEIDTMPHLFKKLEWWEERKTEDMPEYVKTHDKKVFKAHHWDETASLAWIEDECFDIYCDRCLPATEQEYQKFINPPI